MQQKNAGHFVVIVFVSGMLFSCTRPLFVSHLSPQGIALTKHHGYPYPKHNYWSRFICFNKQCIGKAEWVNRQKEHRFKGFKKGDGKNPVKPTEVPDQILLPGDTALVAKNPSDQIIREGKLPDQNEPASFKMERVFILGEVLFELNSAELNPAFVFQLDSLTQLLVSNRNLHARINGYTDNSGSESFNLKLSRDRAKAVSEYLIYKNIEWSRIYYDGLGSSRPIASNNTQEGRRKNRRVEIIISPQD